MRRRKRGQGWPTHEGVACQHLPAGEGGLADQVRPQQRVLQQQRALHLHVAGRAQRIHLLQVPPVRLCLGLKLALRPHPAQASSSTALTSHACLATNPLPPVSLARGVLVKIPHIYGCATPKQGQYALGSRLPGRHISCSGPCKQRKLRMSMAFTTSSLAKEVEHQCGSVLRVVHWP